MATVARTLVAACPARSLLRLRSRRLPSSSSICPARQHAGVGSVRCMARRPDSSYFPLRSGQGGDRAPTEMAPLFPGCDYEHWPIVMDKPGGEGATKHQMIDCYIQTLAQDIPIWRGKGFRWIKLQHLHHFSMLSWMENDANDTGLENSMLGAL
ncbi:Multiple organellar RNA editing factor 2, chloroplastic [Zea mays]|uniref:Multiple organellar RNA editing factor 2, chloroplastic n=1 Tax=Zea mays TaxID=4577 RepID=A0A317Y565_MAIZE|nr:Multiple organellar RNA editing factor 2, chloroplastic [Zea mays]